MPYRVGKTFYTKINGVRRSTGTTNRREAERIEKKWRLESNAIWKTWDQVMSAYLATQNTERPFYAAKAMKPFFTGCYLNQISPQTISEYRSSRGVSASTINRELGVFRAAQRYCKLELNWDIPLVPIKISKPRGRIRWLTKEEYGKLILAAQQSKSHSLPSIIILAVNTGLRRGEILGLQWDRVDLNNRLIYLAPEHQKSGGHSSVPLNNIVVDMLQEMEPKEGHVFTWKGQPIKSVKRSFNHACEVAGIEGFTFHDLRHTCASWMIQAGVPLITVSHILRHKDISTTQIYAHLAPDNVRAGVDALTF